MDNVCSMCGWETTKLQNRYYQYDNTRRFMARVCMNCAELHDDLTSEKVRSV
jgi:hypothetical protein